ncbi:12101_t:CDS:2 [Racocetra persica]|uniref:12101_t:CDS:1 n=1 Tax=Racocetra persica TaxID=160502 RepID=A0ACA9KLF9_9GLOM|nr:12101_t:CDS:2 [Racocetra persica]
MSQPYKKAQPKKTTEFEKKFNLLKELAELFCRVETFAIPVEKDRYHF